MIGTGPLDDVHLLKREPLRKSRRLAPEEAFSLRDSFFPTSERIVEYLERVIPIVEEYTTEGAAFRLELHLCEALSNVRDYAYGLTQVKVARPLYEYLWCSVDFTINRFNPETARLSPWNEDGTLYTEAGNWGHIGMTGVSDSIFYFTRGSGQDTEVNALHTLIPIRNRTLPEIRRSLEQLNVF